MRVLVLKSSLPLPPLPLPELSPVAGKGVCVRVHTGCFKLCL